jgi:hypothetical protein
MKVMLQETKNPVHILQIVRIGRRLMQHKDAVLDLSKYRYPFQLPPY